MPLPAGTELGTHKILSLIGVGGMGEVYKAHDTKLRRDVAIKVLPESFARDADRLARFRREAQLLASLNHPNIATIYNIEDSNDTAYLVMELVPGETLAQRIKREGAVPVDEALVIAKQIAEALEAAHEKGIIHRDLKPANVKLTPEGKVKVLDFGLAKAFAGDGATEDPSNSPTLSMAATMHGVILGTAAYMSPEQARGKAVDKRTDIWAFGCVLYELLTGKQAFTGEDVTEILAAVVTKEPAFDALPRNTPVSIRVLLQRCSRKDRRKRLADASALQIEIEDAIAAPKDSSAIQPAPASTNKLLLVVAAGLVVALILVVALWAPWRMSALADQPLMEFEISPPEGMSFGPVTQGTSAVVSPDGRLIVLVARAKDGTMMLWLRPLASNSPRVLPGTENPLDPFWSPDGRWVNFAAGGKLKRVSVDGGQPQIIVDTTRGFGTSNAGGVTLFADVGKPVQRVATTGGTPAPVFELDGSRGEIAQNNPQFLPDGNHFLYMSNAQETGVVFASLDGKTRRFLFSQSFSPVYYTPNPAGEAGWLLYSVMNQLFARPFDPIKGEVTGQPVPIADSVNSGPTWSVSNNGVLMFRHFRPSQTQLTWFSRDGKPGGAVGEAGRLGRPRISPDQKTVALSRTSDGNSDVWLLDLVRNSTTRFTFEPGANSNPTWSADGQHVFYISQRQNEFLLVERPASGIGAERIVTRSRAGAVATPWAASKDGQWLISNEGGQSRLVLFSLVDGKSVPVTETALASQGSFSPDGRWLLYTLAVSGRNEVFVRTLPKEAGGSGGAGKWQISFSGGTQPTWRADGKEIFYLSPEGALMAVPVESAENSFRPGTPKELFQTRVASSFDVTADGQRFLVNQPVSDSSVTPVTVILNWPQLLKK